MSRLPGRWLVLAALVVALVAADQWTKFLAVERLTHVFERSGDLGLVEKVRGFYGYQHLEMLATEPYYVWRPVWRMSYVENPGAAWGLFRGLSEAFRNAFFKVISVAAVGFILHYYRKLRDDQRFLQTALSFVLAGAVGNFIDRLARGYVVDFVEWYWWNRPDIRWPTFNIADSLIVVGVAMLVVHPGQKREAAGGPSPRRKEAGAA
jgi:signal peptidase II